MNKALYIIGIVLSVTFLFITGYYAAEVSSARIASLFSNSYDFDDLYSSITGYDGTYKELTVEAALWSIVFFLAFLFIDIMGLVKVKTMTAKVLSIIAIAVTGIFLLWDLGVMSSPGSMSFDEVSPAWAFYCFMVLAFSIVGLIQSVRFEKRKSIGASKESKDLLDI